MAWRRDMARLNKRYFNKVQAVYAPYLPPWAMIVHKGRKSGREFRTPVLAWRFGDTLGVVLYYGAESDWLRNVLAAGQAQVIRRGQTLRLTRPRIVPASDEGLGSLLRLMARPAEQVLLADVTE